MAIDTHETYRRLIAAGTPEREADEHARLAGEQGREWTAIRDQIAALRLEMAEFRSEMRQEMGEFRSEMRQEMAEFRGEIRRELADMERRLIIATTLIVSAVVGIAYGLSALF